MTDEAKPKLVDDPTAPTPAADSEPISIAKVNEPTASTPPADSEPISIAKVDDPTTSTPPAGSEPISIAKPVETEPGNFLKRAQSKSASTIAGVEPLLTALPHYRISDAKDFVRLHPDKANYWSPEYCFVNIPILGQKRDLLHMIFEDLATYYLSNSNILRFGLALAAKPNDSQFFLCHIPTQNLDNDWNRSALQACNFSITRWVKAISRAQEGGIGYQPIFARDSDAFPEPRWPNKTLDQLIMATFSGRVIDHDKHPALLRLIGGKQDLR